MCVHATHTVSQELSSADKVLLEEDGVSLPSRYQRKRKWQQLGGSEDERASKTSDSAAKSSPGRCSEQKWEEVKQYLDPNPQLKGVEEGRYATKVSCEVEVTLYRNRHPLIFAE